MSSKLAAESLNIDGTEPVIARRLAVAAWAVSPTCQFFLQAEDGIRDYKVTGVQTCALPISSGPGIAMTQAKQQIDVGGPRPNAWQRDQRVMRGLGVFFGEHIEVQPFRSDLARKMLHRLDLGGRQAEPAQPIGAGAAHRVMVERIKGRVEATPDCARARGRELLSADDMGKPGKAR